MSETLSVLAYNVRDAWGDPKKHEELLDFVWLVNPDVAFFSEAFAERDTGFGTDGVGALKALGYQGHWSWYHDADERRDRHALIGITRTGTGKIHSPSGIRAFYTAKLDTAAGHVDFYGLHGDDRSEGMRREQAVALGAIASPAIVAGDLNNLWRHAPTARVLRALRPLADILPATEPTAARTPLLTRGRTGSLARRLGEMAEGTMLDMLSEYGLKDADPNLQPTKGFAQLDHILVTDGVIVDGFTVHGKTSVSDHRAISARVRLAAR